MLTFNYILGLCYSMLFRQHAVRDDPGVEFVRISTRLELAANFPGLDNFDLPLLLLNRFSNLQTPHLDIWMAPEARNSIRHPDRPRRTKVNYNHNDGYD
jgi:hypothetical protein